MPKQQRFKTKYPGVYFIEGTSADGWPERIYYIVYRKQSKFIEEKAGRQYKKDITPARAAKIRTQRIEGDEPTNQEQREAARHTRETRTLEKLWGEYQISKTLKGISQDRSRFEKYIQPLWDDKEPHEITALEIERLRLRVSKGKSLQTVKLTLSLLRRIVNFGVKRTIRDSWRTSLKKPSKTTAKGKNFRFLKLCKLQMQKERNLNFWERLILSCAFNYCLNKRA